MGYLMSSCLPYASVFKQAELIRNLDFDFFFFFFVLLRQGLLAQASISYLVRSSYLLKFLCQLGVLVQDRSCLVL